MDHRLKKFLLDAGERAAKTFAEGYITMWFLTAGIAKDDIKGSSEAFDTLFTLNNLKAGVVATALSLAASLLSRKKGSDASASLVE